MGLERYVVDAVLIEKRSPTEIAKAHGSAVRAVALAQIESMSCLISGGEDGIIKIWSSSLEEIYNIEIEEEINSLAPLSDSQLAVATARGLLVLKLCRR